MKGKVCDSNMNTVLCVFLAILLLIVLWYVVFGKKNIESFTVAVDADDDGDIDAIAADISRDLTRGVLQADPYSVGVDTVDAITTAGDPAQRAARRI